MVRCGKDGFVGEILSVLGACGLLLPMAVAAGVGIVLAAWYVLRMYQGAFQETPVQPAQFGEIRALDIGLLSPLLALMVVVGVSPGFFPAAVEATVKALPVIVR